MKNFLVDYKEMCLVPPLVWLKKHWKGYILLCVVCGIASFVWTCAQLELSWRDILEGISAKVKKSRD